MRGKRACERVACCKRVARLIYSDVVGWWRERDNYVKRAFWRNLPHFMPPPRQTASRRHYVFDLPVRPSVRPSVCRFFHSSVTKLVSTILWEWVKRFWCRFLAIWRNGDAPLVHAILYSPIIRRHLSKQTTKTNKQINKTLLIQQHILCQSHLTRPSSAIHST